VTFKECRSFNNAHKEHFCSSCNLAGQLYVQVFESKKSVRYYGYTVHPAQFVKVKGMKRGHETSSRKRCYSGLLSKFVSE